MDAHCKHTESDAPRKRLLSLAGPEATTRDLSFWQHFGRCIGTKLFSIGVLENSLEVFKIFAAKLEGCCEPKDVVCCGESFAKGLWPTTLADMDEKSIHTWAGLWQAKI